MNTSQIRSNCEPARRNCCGTRVTSDTECLCCAVLFANGTAADVDLAGSCLGSIVLMSCTDRFKAFNEVYKRFFPKNPPARIFFCVPEWTGPFDVEVDCIAVTKD